MLIGKSSKKPNIETVRRIKRALSEALELSEDSILMVTELACLEEDCAPLETVIGLLRKGLPQIQYKLHKEIEAVQPNDLVQVCAEWGVDVEASFFEAYFA